MVASTARARLCLRPTRPGGKAGRDGGSGTWGCRLDPVKQVAKTLKDHWAAILNAFDSKLTNGRVEGGNSLVQAAKAKACGYGTVKHLITIAYLVAGKLTHLPASPFKLKACAVPLS